MHSTAEREPTRPWTLTSFFYRELRATGQDSAFVSAQWGGNPLLGALVNSTQSTIGSTYAAAIASLPYKSPGRPTPLAGRDPITRRNKSRWRRSSSFVVCLNLRIASRSILQAPPLSPLRAVRALPASVRGPVDRSHGRHVRISFACSARRSGVQPFAMNCPH